MVNIRLNLTLIDFAGKKDIVLKIEEPTSLINLLEHIRVPPEEVGLVTKNGKWASMECEVDKGDSIELFPHLSGG